jgi:RNA polymerase sigma-70 factor (ECF subfamily)
MGVLDPSKADDRDLLLQIALGDSEALASLYDRFAPRLLGLLVRLIGSRADAEDLLQDTFLQVWRKAADYDPGRSSPLTWLLLIARSRALDYLRRHRMAAVSRVIDTPVYHDSFGDLERDESVTRLHELLNELPESQRAALALSFFGGLSHTEIAERNGVSLGTAKTRIRLGLQRLRDLLDESHTGAHG